jgi:hypothetical protein
MEMLAAHWIGVCSLIGLLVCFVAALELQDPVIFKKKDKK